MENKASSIVIDYGKAKSSYEQCTTKLHELINSLIEESDIQIHSVSSRTKDTDSLYEKVKRKGDKYNKLSDITDLSGIRIICYLSDQVDKVADIIEKNFIILNEWSIDKRKTLDPDKFGYLSLHFVVKLSEDRSKLLEYKRFKDFYCEIQIRSILQHAWAEIEHDLGYKSTIEIPRDVQRRFYRLAGLLELADDEFNRIKSEVEQYSAEIDDNIFKKPEEILIDKVSLKHFIINSQIVKDLDEIIASNANLRLDENVYDISVYISQIAYFNIKTIDDLEKTIENNKEKIISFTKGWLNPSKSDFDSSYLNRGISLFYLYYVLIGATQDYEKIIEYVQSFISDLEYDETATRILELYDKI